MEDIWSTKDCIIHCSKNSNRLVKMQDERSWSTLVDAAVIPEAFFKTCIIFGDQEYYTSFERFFF